MNNDKNDIPKSQEIVPVGEPSTEVARFGTEKPSELVKKATAVANSLSPIIDKKQLFTMISNKKYVQAEGWTTMGAMLGAFPEVEWTKKLPNGWEARVNIRTLQGQIISSAEAMCTRDERNWKSRDEYALRSMAQTRATGKAFRLPFAWIMTLAGYEATPAEEMSEAPVKQTTYSPQISPAQSAKIYALLHNLKKTKEEFEVGIKRSIKDLTRDQASKLIEKMEKIKAQKEKEVEKEPEVVTARDEQPKTETIKQPDGSEITKEEFDEMMTKADEKA